MKPGALTRRAEILVVHPGALGDVLLAVPALRGLRVPRPDARIVLAAEPRVGALLTLLGAVDDHVRFEALGLDALFRDDAPLGARSVSEKPKSRSAPGRRGAPRVPRGAPERVGAWGPSRPPLDRPGHVGAPHVPSAEAGLGRLGRVAASAGVVSWFGARDPAFVAGLRALAPGAVVAPSVPADGLVWEHLLATACEGPAGRGLGVSDELVSPLSAPAALIAEGAGALRGAGWDGETPLLLVHPGAGGIAKRWPAEGFAHAVRDVASRRRLAVVVHRGPADADAMADFRARHPGPIIPLIDPPLPLLAGVLARVSAYLGNDSGVSHLAAALGVRSLVLFTPSNLAWRPWSRTARPLVVDTATLSRADVDAVIAGLTRLAG